ncbi:MAG TPA: TIGR03790 family protein [Kiritimatiellia bacterium]|nr:TIGR03790 family protein [Kiritimatiellia bacterium]HRZ13155.1 TIGR03790 family protein [Kiritimatiellia bacterium]HSA17576.1 TIGR03790 family protein [Kiritimatiellia bacterium]
MRTKGPGVLESRDARLFSLALALLACAARADDPALRTVVLANRRVPESVELARHYMQARGIPADRLCALDLPAGETLMREVYEVRLRDPLLAFLRERRLIEQVRRPSDSVRRHESEWQTLSTSIRYVVSMYGVPVRIADTRWRIGEAIANRLRRFDLKDAAAVDSELALLLNADYPIRGPYPNPLFNQMNEADAPPSAALILIAARLDGPDAATVRRMIDDARTAEARGLEGRAYVDGRGLAHGSYALGDFWLSEAAERLLREGLDVVQDSAEPVWGPAFPMEQAAVYLGWYNENATGPFLQPGFRFEPGAVAYHIHSTSAEKLRTPAEHWTGPLLAAGASASMGCVGEPLLNLTPHLSVFIDRLCRGLTFGESAYLAQPVLSWQVTVVGDPLYRPFRHVPGEESAPATDWARARAVNQLVRAGRFNIGLGLCRRWLAETGSPILREKLAELYARNDLFPEAAEEYRAVAEQAATADTAVRAGALALRILRVLNRTTEADALEQTLRGRWKDSVVLPWLETGRLEEDAPAESPSLTPGS